jgi:hypothetical protein
VQVRIIWNFVVYFFSFFLLRNSIIWIMIRAELEQSTRAHDRPKWSSSSSSSDSSFSYASQARALLFVKCAEPEQAIPAQDRLVYTPNHHARLTFSFLFFFCMNNSSLVQLLTRVSMWLRHIIQCHFYDPYIARIILFLELGRGKSPNSVY